MELTGTGNNVLTRLLHGDLHEGIGLGQTLKTLHQLGQILGVPALHGHTHDGGHGILHHAHVVGVLVRGDSTGLDEVLVNTHQTDNVAGRHILDGLSVATHHEHGALDGLEVQILLLARHVVGAHDAHLLAGGDLAGEHTAEGEEATAVRGRHHLADVHHQGAVLVAVLHADGHLVIEGTLVQHVRAVLLRSVGGGQVNGDHLQEGITGGQPLAHDGLEQGLALLVLLVRGKLDTEDGAQLLDLVALVLEHGVHQLVDGVQHELAETAHIAGLGLLLPLALGVAVEVVAPEAGHELLRLHLKFAGVDVSELLEREGPALQTGTEGHGTSNGGHLDVAHGAALLTVGGNDDVDVLNDALEGLVHVLLLELKLEKSTIHLVHHQNGANALGNGLAKHSLGLHAHTGHAVDDDQGTVRHTEGGSNLR
eukprot:comp19862_c0_seq1/m.23991 comp19862_c0_seq1/g.23991  ORF comp19862_c0_seq1/g.23991 comp19862_c0_seq1/m.23991 type:complete len:424 (+) comp19862_c0_seq1:1202-2473(+)